MVDLGQMVFHGWTAFGITGSRETANVYNDGIAALGASNGIGGKWGQAGYLLSSCIGCGLLKSNFLFLFLIWQPRAAFLLFSLITMIPQSLHLPGCFFAVQCNKNADRFSQKLLSTFHMIHTSDFLFVTWLGIAGLLLA
ncbi:hypothetical protein QBC32DRAFT_45030 [Pseudoneurospora amorphoporcata]|uniref:Uncharacterized protein n=1 Tax=Pseudoneurospora amorphoporcata TaxID=241081 RepID=A0AAN6NQ82_9PEZI|nr:hypothetical protein QBC32DRAFT_45030 [Pseudoneurospora amorphoporcata]